MKISHQIVISIALAIGVVAALAQIYFEPPPVFKNGDLVVQTGFDQKATAIATATDSKFNRIGIIKKTPFGDVVITDDIDKPEVPLDKWLNQGLFKRYAIYRYRDFQNEKSKKIIDAANAILAKRNTEFFNFGLRQPYSSALVYLAYRDNGIDLGHTQKLRDLNIDNMVLRSIIYANWESYPLCSSQDGGQAKTYADCRELIAEQDVITPLSIIKDVNLELIYSNYPW